MLGQPDLTSLAFMLRGSRDQPTEFTAMFFAGTRRMRLNESPCARVGWWVGGGRAFVMTWPWLWLWGGWWGWIEAGW
eukprot:6190342-Pleurochrysis_carterae.AAC.1